MTHSYVSYDDSVAASRADFVARGGNQSTFNKALADRLRDLRDNPRMHPADDYGVRRVMLHPTNYQLAWDVVDNIAEPLRVKWARQIDTG